MAPLGQISHHVGLDVDGVNVAPRHSAGQAHGEVARARADVGHEGVGGEGEGANHVVGLLPGVARGIVEDARPALCVLELVLVVPARVRPGAPGSRQDDQGQKSRPSQPPNGASARHLTAATQSAIWTRPTSSYVPFPRGRKIEASPSLTSNQSLPRASRMLGLWVTIRVLVRGSGAVAMRVRRACARRLFSLGLTTRPPSVTSLVAVGSLAAISRAVSTARWKRLEYDWPTGTPAARKASPMALASARPLSLSCRCRSTLAKLSGSVSAWSGWVAPWRTTMT